MSDDTTIPQESPGTIASIIACVAEACADEALSQGACPCRLTSEEDAERGDYEFLDEELGRAATLAERRAFRTAYSERLLVEGSRREEAARVRR